MEGLSAAAISYYAVALFKIMVEGAAKRWHTVDPTLATGLAAPVILLAVWLFLRRIRASILQDHDTSAAHAAPRR